MKSLFEIIVWSTRSKAQLRSQKRPSEQPLDSTAEIAYSRKEPTADDVP